MTGRHLRTPQDLGAAIRDERRAQALTQAELARAAQVSREWLIGVEQGARPRAELKMILTVLAALDLSLSVGSNRPTASEAPKPPDQDPVSLTDRVTHEAIEATREASKIPAVAEHGLRASRLLGAGVDPELAAHLTRLSMEVHPGADSPAESGEDVP
jgi:HTH-type transcriptional regulator / antitoxin HipB